MINEHEPLVALSPLAASVAEEDLSLARLSEGHTDALAILAELGAGPRAAGGWRLAAGGIKRYCSGARSCTHALVTAAAGLAPRTVYPSTTESEKGGRSQAGRRSGARVAPSQAHIGAFAGRGGHVPSYPGRVSPPMGARTSPE
jgi:hypothetical protein